MDLFLDSNVIIGYSLYLDPWHKYAEMFLKKKISLIGQKL